MDQVSGLQKYGFQNFIPLDMAINQYFPRFAPLESEDVGLELALNRILGADIIAPINLPPFDRSAMDGFAINANDSFGASALKPKQLDIVGEIAIGDKPSYNLRSGQAMAIATGAPLPHGADAVIRVEETKAEGNRLKIFQAIPPQQNVSFEGEEVTKGAIVLRKGEEIRPDQLGLLRSMGMEKIKVARQPRLILLATGDELSPPGKLLVPGKIFDSNNLMNSALLSRYGAVVIAQKVLPDNPDVIRREILVAINAADAVVCSGGTSVGSKDFLPRVVQDVGEIVVHGVGSNPGSPILLGIISGKPIVCLPGFPVANYIGIVKILGPLLRQLQGARIRDPRPFVFGRIAKNVSVKGLGRINYLRVNLQETGAGFAIIPKALSGSRILRSLTESDGLVEIPADVEGLEEGQIVKVFLHLR